MTQTFSFNLVDKAWIPCVRADGIAAVLSLRDTFAQAHTLKAIAGESPLVTVALHRFLLAILHRVFGPADYEEWSELWEAKRWDMDALNIYLDEWRHRFDLFDQERPFYQSSTLYMESKWVSVRRLAHHLSAMNTLFDHYDTVNSGSFSPQVAARMLIASQIFSIGGTSGAFHPQLNPRAKKKQAMFTDCISTRGITFLIRGESLFETLMLNLIQYPDEQVMICFKDDAPSWERNDPSSPNRKPLAGFLDYLTWQNRRVLLQPEIDFAGELVVKQMRWEPASRLGGEFLDSMQHYIKNKKKGYRLLRFSEGKVLWRDSSALLAMHNLDANSSINLPPYTFRWLKEIADEEDSDLQEEQIFQVMALGMSSKPGQAVVYFYREEHLSLPLAYFQKSELVGKLDAELVFTEEVAQSVRFAVQIMGMQWREADADNKAWGGLNRNAKNSINDWVDYTGMERTYWASLDIPFQSLIIELAQDAAKASAAWRDQLRQSALVAFEQVTEYVGNDGRSFKAIVRGQSYLTYRLNEILPKQEEAV